MASRRAMNPSRRASDSGSIPLVGSLHQKSRSSPLLSIGLVVVAAFFLIGYALRGSGGFASEKEAISIGQGVSCSSDVIQALPILKKAYGDSMRKVLHVGPDSCAVISKLLKEEDSEAWGVEPYDLEDTDNSCKSLIGKGFVRVSDLKFPLPYRPKSFSLAIVSDSLDYLSPKYLNKTLPDLARLSRQTESQGLRAGKIWKSSLKASALTPLLSFLLASASRFSPPFHPPAISAFPRSYAEMSEAGSKLFERNQAIYKNLDERFEIHTEKYQGQQYSHLYFTRLHHMRNLLYSLVPKWKPNLPVKTVLGLAEGEECIIVGTIYKHMKLKPSILDEYSKERFKVPLVKPHNFLHPDDHLILEDESGRVTLTGSLLDPSAFVTGVVVALHGKETSKGDFLVQDILEAGIPPQTELPLSSREDKYVVFVSGLSIGSSVFNPLQFQLLIDHITGHLGDENEQSIASQVVRLVVAGNSIQIPQGLLSGHVIL